MFLNYRQTRELDKEQASVIDLKTKKSRKEFRRGFSTGICCMSLVFIAGCCYKYALSPKAIVFKQKSILQLIMYQLKTTRGEFYIGLILAILMGVALQPVDSSI